ncbi:acyl-CoA dehydrogenase family protein [Streptomyces sp. NPDC048479]|uniref:acyl-CoA dehydrogenase family protein n=1 Tax=Streptomyces sp. NPDC048479 TaxID=3154725 RepID=UPI0034406FD4
MTALKSPSGRRTASLEPGAQQADRFAMELAERLRATGENAYQGSPSDADSREAYTAYGAGGYIGLHWPKNLGGQGLSPLETVAVEEVFGYHWLPMSSYLLSVKTIGNALLQFGSPELVERLLPRIAAGELVFCQGFSEPEAGSDLASLRTRARLEGDRWIVNGRKIWTSSAEHADWAYLAVRTNPDEPRHRGLSVLVADMRTPGIDVTVHRTLGGGTIGELALTDVEIPCDQVVGEVDAGWSVLMGTLDHERVTSEKVGVVCSLLDLLVEHAVTSAQRRLLSRLRGEAAVARLHGRHATELLARRTPAAAASSMAKLSVAVLMQRLAGIAVDLLGPHALVENGPDALLGGRLAAFHRAAVATTIAGGASDIQRRNIARQGLGFGR